MAKPFVKWAGGKGKLINTIEKRLPADFDSQKSVTYIEPFVGGGAFLFYMLSNHRNISRVIINDINPTLINCYRRIQVSPKQFIKKLSKLEKEYLSITNIEDKHRYYYQARNIFNELHDKNSLTAAIYFIFLNKTCFNGLYRENAHGKFNVPIGSYHNPTICNAPQIMEVHKALQNVEILCGDYVDVMSRIDWNEYNFFYFDPPYRPLLNSNNFRDYCLAGFDDSNQENLADLCRFINNHGGRFLVSNSNSEIQPGVNYFKELYTPFHFETINAPRFIRCQYDAKDVIMYNYESK